MKPDIAFPVRWLVAVAWAGAVLLPGASALASEEKGAASTWAAGHRYERSVRSYTIPDIVLVDADARPVRLRDLLAGEDPVMLNFLFTTCSTVCPVMVKVFADVPSRLGAAAKDLRLISISIDPENDTPAQLKSWSSRFGHGARWHFLTGRIEAIRNVQVAFDNYRSDKMAHEPLTLIRRSGSQSWVRIDGFASPDELAGEYAAAPLR